VSAAVTTFDAGDGRRLSWLRHGSGQPVVCVPGGPGMDPAAYFATLDLPGCELAILAPRGTGASTPPHELEGYRIPGYVEDLEALRIYLGLERMSLLGSSHGGCVVLAYAIVHPQRVDRLVISGAPPRMDAGFRAAVAAARRGFVAAFTDGAERLAASDEAGAALAGVDAEEDRRRLLRVVLGRHVARLGFAQSAYLDGICAAPLNWDAPGVMFTEMRDGLDLLADAGRVTSPALLIAGEWDVVVPPAITRLIAETLPTAQYVQLPDAGHFVEVEAHHAFTATASAFLNRNSRSAARRS
jgi:pimeloyl-ACP methyl ester carboxylesterase